MMTWPESNITSANVAINTLTTGLRFPEGPAFAPDGSLWAVELKGESLVRFQKGQVARFQVGGQPNGIAIDAQCLIWFCDAGQRAIRRFDPQTNRTDTIVTSLDNQPFDKPNDLAFDAIGNLVFTCPGESRQEPTGYVCVLTTSGDVRKITDGKYFPNGLAFTADGRELIIAETYRHRLWKGRWDAQTAQWTDAHIWATVDGPQGPGGPDGMAFGEDGNLYVAVYGTGKIHVINHGGQVIRYLNLPGQNPTNCAFDPTGRFSLVVTEAEKGELLSCSIAVQGSHLFNPTVFITPINQ
ncbi:SMP-30/gluconolactonase/LRE family protein [Spirosoma soli]